MVPVPEELAAQVLTYVSWKDAQANAGPPLAEGQAATDEAIARAFARLDDASRALVTVIATATLEPEQLSITEAARRARVTVREALGILLEVNAIVASARRAAACLWRQGHRRAPGGWVHLGLPCSHGAGGAGAAIRRSGTGARVRVSRKTRCS